MRSRERRLRCREQNDRVVDFILEDLSQAEQVAALKVLNQLLEASARGFQLRKELLHAVLLCSLMLTRALARRTSNAHA